MADTLMLSRATVTALLVNPDFTGKFPEFAPVAAHKPQPVRGGCSGCRKRRAEVNMLNDFLTVLRRMPPPRVSAFKQYMHTTEIVYNTTSDGQYTSGHL